MTGNGRGTMRPPGRTPPFLLIGLLVVICILGFSYWNASGTGKERAAQIVVLQDEVRVLSTRKLEAEKRSESANTKVKVLERDSADLHNKMMNSEKSFEDTKIRLKTKEDEVQSVKDELENKRESLSKCEQESSGIQQELQQLKEEVESLKQEAANKPADCDQNACADPIKNVLTILVNSLGRSQVIAALQSNNYDVNKFIPADANVQTGQQPGNNPANPQQPAGNVEVNPADQQQPGVNPADNQQQLNPAGQQQPAGNPAVNPADQQQPGVQPGDQAGIGQVQPPKDLANPGGEDNTIKVGTSSLSNGMPVNLQPSLNNQPAVLPFLNQIPHVGRPQNFGLPNNLPLPNPNNLPFPNPNNLPFPNPNNLPLPNPNSPSLPSPLDKPLNLPEAVRPADNNNAENNVQPSLNNDMQPGENQDRLVENDPKLVESGYNDRPENSQNDRPDHVDPDETDNIHDPIETIDKKIKQEHAESDYDDTQDHAKADNPNNMRYENNDKPVETRDHIESGDPGRVGQGDLNKDSDDYGLAADPVNVQDEEEEGEREEEGNKELKFEPNATH